MSSAPASIVRNGIRLGHDPKRAADQPREAPAAGVQVASFTATGIGSDRPSSVTIYQGDCRTVIPAQVKPRSVDLIFADPPFNWKRAYDKWEDDLPREEYLRFTREWLDACVESLSDTGSFWVNIPDDWAADIVVHLRDARGLKMINWCIWHYRFGQNTTSRFINSKVHALYFARHRHAKDSSEGRIWNPDEILEISDRRSIYGDPRTESKRDGIDAGHRVPMDVWYGQYWGRVQGNNLERRGYHDNQLPEVYLERVIRACSNPGDTVMDPFLGSGTTGVLAHALGRDFIGVEFSEANARSALARMHAGPIRLGAAKGQSTAIFENRRAPRTPQQPPEGKSTKQPRRARRKKA